MIGPSYGLKIIAITADAAMT